MKSVFLGDWNKDFTECASSVWRENWVSLLHHLYKKTTEIWACTNQKYVKGFSVDGHSNKTVDNTKTVIVKTSRHKKNSLTVLSCRADWTKLLPSLIFERCFLKALRLKYKNYDRWKRDKVMGR